MNQTRFNKVKGGYITVNQDSEFHRKRAVTPGPDKYNPDKNKIKTRPPSYFIAEKTSTSHMKNLVGTTEVVGPGKYKVDGKYTSKHLKQPLWTFTKSVRPQTSSNISKNQTYFNYSSLGNQVISYKKSETKASIGKEKKDKIVRGLLPSHISFKPTKVFIPHPVI